MILSWAVHYKPIDLFEMHLIVSKEKSGHLWDCLGLWELHTYMHNTGFRIWLGLQQEPRAEWEMHVYRSASFISNNELLYIWAADGVFVVIQMFKDSKSSFTVISKSVRKIKLRTTAFWCGFLLNFVHLQTNLYRFISGQWIILDTIIFDWENQWEFDKIELLCNLKK